MKTKVELDELIQKIASSESPVGMDAVYVHALILDQLSQIEKRLRQLESTVEALQRNSRSSSPAVQNRDI